MIKLNFYENLFDAELIDPKTIKAKFNETDEDYAYLELSKSAIKRLYGSEGPLKIPFKTSQKLYEDVDSEYWKAYISKGLEDSGFLFSNYQYIAADGILLEIMNKNENVEVDKMKENYEKLTNNLSTIEDKKEMFDLDTYYEKVLIKLDKEEKFTNVIAIEMDYRESKYSLTAGIEIDKMLWFHTTKNLDENNLVDFLLKIDLEDEVSLANKFGAALYKDYDFDTSLGTIDKTLSLSELFSTLKQIKVNILYEKDRKHPDYGQVTELEHIDEGSIIGSKIIWNINTYDTPFKALKRLLSLEKSFKDTGITFKEMLSLMYQEYFNINISVKASDIISLRNKITKRKNDFNVIKEGIKKLEVDLDN